MVMRTTGGGLIARVRRAAGLSQAELARRAGTSRPTLSAYEHGRKSPSLDTLERLVAAAGFELAAHPVVSFSTVTGPRGRMSVVPDRLPRLAAEAAFGTVALPLTVNWSEPGRMFRLADRGDRARLYEVVLREGTAEDVVRYVDGALLVDLWDELVLPKTVAWRRQWRRHRSDPVPDRGRETVLRTPASDRFLLAGGAALLAQHLTMRPPQDLDFFTRPGAGDVRVAREAFVAAAHERSWSVEQVQDSQTFCRLLVHGPEDLLVDLALDSAPGRAPTASIAGPTFAPAELAGRTRRPQVDRPVRSCRGT